MRKHLQILVLDVSRDFQERLGFILLHHSLHKLASFIDLELVEVRPGAIGVIEAINFFTDN